MSASGAGAMLSNIWRRRRESPPPSILRAVRGRAPSAGIVLPDAEAVDPPRRIRRSAARQAGKR